MSRPHGWLLLISVFPILCAEPCWAGSPIAAVDGWSVTVSGSFRVLHHNTPVLAAKVGRIAEAARAAAERKWFGRAGENWQPLCQVYLHRTATEYAQATGVPQHVPGHSTTRCEGGRVIARRIDLCGDAANLFSAVLPHEVTHVVMAGKFGDKPLPPWADEAMAVLAEPRPCIERHLRNLPRYWREGQLLRLGQILRMEDYPNSRQLGPFYAESASLVEFLATEKSPEVFPRFIRDSLRIGTEKALKQHYGMGLAQLEQRWRRYAFGDRLFASVPAGQ